MAMKTKLRTLLDTTFDTGLYTGSGRVGKSTYNECKAKRDRLWHELEDDIDDLLEACKRLLEGIHEQGYDYFNSPILGAIEDVQEAIAKAEGE